MNKGDSMKSARLHSPMRRQLIATAAAAMLLGVTGAQAAGGQLIGVGQRRTKRCRTSR